MNITPFKYLYPFTSHWLHLDDINYHFLDEGSKDAPPIVMLHGNPTWSFYYRTLIPELSKTHRVIVPDHVGCGFSDKPQDYPYTLEQHIQNLEVLINHLGLEHITFVLHDWGGAIGMGYATRHPKKASRFVIFNTAAFLSNKVPLRIKICRVPIIGAFLVRALNGFALAAFKFATKQPRRFSKQVRTGYIAPYDNWQNRIAIHRFVCDIPLEANHPTRKTVEEIDSKLYLLRDCQMLIIWGKGDFCFTERDFLPMWQTRFPDAEVHVIPNAGHYVVEDAHEQILPYIEQFLNVEIFSGSYSPTK